MLRDRLRKAKANLNREWHTGQFWVADAIGGALVTTAAGIAFGPWTAFLALVLVLSAIVAFVALVDLITGVELPPGRASLLALLIVAFGVITFQVGRESRDEDENFNKYVCRHDVEPIEARGEYASLLEFGVIYKASSGMTVLVDFGVPILFADNWFGPPLQKKKSVDEGMSQGLSAPFLRAGSGVVDIYDHRSIEPGRFSYYLYVETGSPPKIGRLDFVEDWLIGDSLTIAELSKRISPCPL